MKTSILSLLREYLTTAIEANISIKKAQDMAYQAQKAQIDVSVKLKERTEKEIKFLDNANH